MKQYFLVSKNGKTSRGYLSLHHALSLVRRMDFGVCDDVRVFDTLGNSYNIFTGVKK